MKNILLFFLCSVSAIGSLAQTTVTLTANRDLGLGYHDNYNTENTNYDGGPQTASFIIPGAQGGVNSNRGLLDFDLSSIPSGSTITEAKLNLYALVGVMNHPDLDQGHIGDNASYLRRITSSWIEGTTTWNTAPSYTTANQVTLAQSTSASQDYLDIDVTALVQDMIDNPSSSHGFWLGLVDETLPSKGLVFCSLDHGVPAKYPTLEITYSCAPLTASLTANRDLGLGYHDNYNTENTNYDGGPQTASFIIPGAQGGVNSNRGLFDFDLSTIPSGSTIIDAQLDLFALVGVMNHPDLDQGHIGDNASYLRRITSSWIEGTTTWNTAPSYTTANQVTLAQSTSASQDYLDIDVTALVQDMIDNPSSSHGFWLGLVDETLPSKGLVFCSLDHGVPAKYPKLDIIYQCSNASSINDKDDKNSFPLYPNPTNGLVTLNLSGIDAKSAVVSIYDFSGKLLSTVWVNNPQTKGKHLVDLSSYSSGIYFIRIDTDNKMYSSKVIKQ